MVRRAGAGNDDGVSGTDFVGEATTELYGSDPEGFTERRAALAAQARAAGDRPAAKEIAGLRKPTRPAWMINQLVRADPGVAGRLVQLGDELRAAAAALDGAKIRELSQERRRLVDSLIRQALQHAGEEAPSAALREDLTATFGAAVADPQVARNWRRGRCCGRSTALISVPGCPGWPWFRRPRRPPTASGGRGPAGGAAAGKARTAAGKAADRPKAAGRARARDEARAAEEAKAAREAKAAEEARAAARARAAEERRRAIADAEQVAAEASRAADQAAQDERDEQDQVWGLEDQLDEARRRLSATRRRVRETQNAQQKARRALSRLKDTER